MAISKWNDLNKRQKAKLDNNRHKHVQCNSIVFLQTQIVFAWISVGKISLLLVQFFQIIRQKITPKFVEFVCLLGIVVAAHYNFFTPIICASIWGWPMLLYIIDYEKCVAWLQTDILASRRITTSWTIKANHFSAFSNAVERMSLVSLLVAFLPRNSTRWNSACF